MNIQRIWQSHVVQPLDETAETLPRKFFTVTNKNTIRIPAMTVPKTGTIPATIRGAERTVLLFKLQLCITNYHW